ncbi:MAG: hypothetical protein JNJ52_13645 [Flavobacterium sp.]|nr:hypothetical protein [Flavobacterium sp.]
MKSFDSILQHVNSFHELGETIPAAEFVMKEYGLEHPRFKGFELREKAEPSFILMTTEGEFGQPQIIKIPENTFSFDFVLMLNLLAHEMVHVIQKTTQPYIEDRNEREWQAYYEMLFHKIFPQIPQPSLFHRKLFAKKAIEYYNRMEKGGELQQKYADQKEEVEQLLLSLN